MLLGEGEWSLFLLGLRYRLILREFDDRYFLGRRELEKIEKKKKLKKRKSKSNNSINKKEIKVLGEEGLNFVLGRFVKGRLIFNKF